MENNGTEQEQQQRQDPSTLTIRMLQREVTALQKLFEIRLDAIDRAQILFHDDMVRVPTSVDKAIANLKELLQEMGKQRFITIDERFYRVEQKFESIQTQFKERDTRTEQIARSNETALTAALNAAKEAVLQQNIAFVQATNKSETGFIKQIDQIVNLFQTGMKAFDEKMGMATKTSDDKIANVEKQLTLLIGTGMGQSVQQKTHATDNSFVVSIIAIGLSLIGVVSLIIFNIIKQ